MNKKLENVRRAIVNGFTMEDTLVAISGGGEDYTIFNTPTGRCIVADNNLLLDELKKEFNFIEGQPLKVIDRPVSPAVARISGFVQMGSQALAKTIDKFISDEQIAVKNDYISRVPSKFSSKEVKEFEKLCEKCDKAGINVLYPGNFNKIVDGTEFKHLDSRKLEGLIYASINTMAEKEIDFRGALKDIKKSCDRGWDR